MIFISSPYGHENKDVVQQRYVAACKYAGYLMEKGLIAMSPVVPGHAICQHVGLPGDFTFWKNFCIKLIDVSNEVHVLQLDGWETSAGVIAELDHARITNKPIVFVEPAQVGIDNVY